MRKKLLIVGLCLVVLVGLCVAVFKGAQHLGAQRRMPVTYTFDGTKYWSSENSWLGLQFHLCWAPLSVCGAPDSNADNAQNMTLLATKGSKPSMQIYSIGGHDKNTVIGVIQYNEAWNTDYYGHQVYQNPTIYTAQPVTTLAQAIDVAQPSVIINTSSDYSESGFFYNSDDTGALASLLRQMSATPAMALAPVNLTENPVGPKLDDLQSTRDITLCDATERICIGGINGLSYFTTSSGATYVYYQNWKAKNNADLFKGWQVSSQLAALLNEDCPDCRATPPR